MIIRLIFARIVARIYDHFIKNYPVVALRACHYQKQIAVLCAVAHQIGLIAGFKVF